jgi:hypothetical protein
MKKVDKATIRGVLIGDSHLRHRFKIAELQIGHSLKWKEYFLFKHRFLEESLEKEIKYSEVKTKNGHEIIRLSITDKYFNFCYKWLYKPDKKITLKYLRKVNNRGVAFWYMDDGSLYAKKRDGETHAYELVISMYVTENEANDVIEFMQERFDCKFTLKYNKGKYSVRCGTKEAKKFLAQIEEYIPSCMSHKLFA